MGSSWPPSQAWQWEGGRGEQHPSYGQTGTKSLETPAAETRWKGDCRDIHPILPGTLKPTTLPRPRRPHPSSGSSFISPAPD